MATKKWPTVQPATEDQSQAQTITKANIPSYVLKMGGGLGMLAQITRAGVPVAKKQVEATVQGVGTAEVKTEKTRDEIVKEQEAYAAEWHGKQKTLLTMLPVASDNARSHLRPTGRQVSIAKSVEKPSDAPQLQKSSVTIKPVWKPSNVSTAPGSMPVGTATVNPADWRSSLKKTGGATASPTHASVSAATSNAEEQAKKEKQDQEAKAKKEAAEAAEKAKKDAEAAKAKADAEAQTKREAEQKAAQAEKEAKAKKEAAEKAKRDAEAKANAEAELLAEEAKKEAEKKAAMEKEEKEKKLAAALAAEKAQKEAEDQARKDAEEKAKQKEERAKQAEIDAQEAAEAAAAAAAAAAAVAEAEAPAEPTSENNTPRKKKKKSKSRRHGTESVEAPSSPREEESVAAVETPTDLPADGKKHRKKKKKSKSNTDDSIVVMEEAVAETVEEAESTPVKSSRKSKSGDIDAIETESPSEHKRKHKKHKHKHSHHHEEQDQVEEQQETAQEEALPVEETPASEQTKASTGADVSKSESNDTESVQAVSETTPTSVEVLETHQESAKILDTETGTAASTATHTAEPSSSSTSTKAVPVVSKLSVNTEQAEKSHPTAISPRSQSVHFSPQIEPGVIDPAAETKQARTLTRRLSTRHGEKVSLDRLIACDPAAVAAADSGVVKEERAPAAQVDFRSVLKSKRQSLVVPPSAAIHQMN